jgi:multiple sugar transport system ATP-binding protein
MAKVTLTNVSKIYRGSKGSEIAAINRINLQIEDRALTVVTGPRSSGKSTLLRMIAGLEEISQGEIHIDDRRSNDLPTSKRDLAMVFANNSLYPRMTVYENIAFGMHRRKFGQPEIKKRTGEVVGILEIEQLLALKPGALSHAQKQRVAIARAVALQPKVFLFDEPLVQLDVTNRGELRTQITKLHERLQSTMIYATADSLEAMSIADQIVMLHNGAVQQTGTPRVLYDQPVDLFVAGFIGEPPMNLVRGELRQERNALVFSEAGDGTIEAQLGNMNSSALREFIGKQLSLGIRPDAIEVADFAPWNEKTSAKFPVLVDRVESLGGAANIYLQTGAHTLVCHTRHLLDRRQAARRMHFKIDLERVHFFDPASRKRIV